MRLSRNTTSTRKVHHQLQAHCIHCFEYGKSSVTSSLKWGRYSISFAHYSAQTWWCTYRFSEMPANKFVESSFWNFDALYVPQQHPARELQDTFYIKGKWPWNFINLALIMRMAGSFQTQLHPILSLLNTWTKSEKLMKQDAENRSGTDINGNNLKQKRSSSERTPHPSLLKCCTN